MNLLCRVVWVAGTFLLVGVAATAASRSVETSNEHILALIDDDPVTRRDAYGELRALLRSHVGSLGREASAEIGVKALVGDLLDVATTGNPTTRNLAMRLLEELGADLARRMVRGRNVGRAPAAEALADLIHRSEAVLVGGDPRQQRLASRLAAEGIHAYGAALQSSDRSERRLGASGLREIVDQFSGLLATERLRGKTLRLSEELLEALLEVLGKALESPDPKVRETALRVTEDLADALAVVVEEGSARSRRLAGDLLSMVRGMLDDEDESVRGAARRALDKLPAEKS